MWVKEVIPDKAKLRGYETKSHLSFNSHNSPFGVGGIKVKTTHYQIPPHDGRQYFVWLSRFSDV